jgi:uncharacterized membrane protein (UPF0136 family)
MAIPVITLLVFTGTIAYICKRIPSPPTPNFPTNIALALSLLTTLGGATIHIRKGSVTTTIAGFTLSALYLLSFVRLRAGQTYGNEIGLLASICMVVTSMPRADWTVRSLPMELAWPACFGIVIFGIAVHFWVGLGCSIATICYTLV